MTSRPSSQTPFFVTTRLRAPASFHRRALGICAMGVCAMGVFALAGCPEDLNGDGDAGVKLDGQVRRDARMDAMVGVDASDTCGPEDLIFQAMCGMGHKCTLTNGTSTVGCAESGSTPAYESCEPVFPDDCEAWSLCSNAAGSYMCLPFCTETGYYCEGGRCGDVEVASEGDFKVYLCLPADGCDPQTPFASESGCATGEACYLTSVGEGMTFCEPEGTAAPGEDCTSDFSCQQGHACFGPPGEGVCRRICRAGVDTDCPSEQLCSPLDEQYGICF